MFYVYTYIRDKDSQTARAGTSYYAGKGKNKCSRKKHAYLRPPEDKSRIIILESNLSELGAFAIERRMIRWHGMKDLGMGILENKSDCSKGSSGTVHSIETRRKRSQLLIGNKGTMLGKSKHRKLKIKYLRQIKAGFYLRGNWDIPCHRQEKDRISAAQKGIPKPKFKCIHCNKEASIARLTQWHNGNCKVCH